MGKKNIYKVISVLIFLFIIVASLNAFDFNFVTVSDVVKKVKKRFGTIETYRAKLLNIDLKISC